MLRVNRIVASVRDTFSRPDFSRPEPCGSESRPVELKKDKETEERQRGQAPNGRCKFPDKIDIARFRKRSSGQNQD